MWWNLCYTTLVEKLILVDGSGLIYRGFYAIPPFFKSPSGVQTNAVFGFTAILLSLLSTQKPDYMAVAFDKKGPTFRHKEFKEYKATRVKAPQELYDQIPLVKSVVTAFGIPGFEVESYEADDIIATIDKKLAKSGIDILIATGDFDMFQLVSANTSILYPAKGFKEAETLRLDDVEKKYGLTPEQIPDYKGIAGDSSDNLPGVKGIGEKGAKDLLHKYQTLENIYAHLAELSPVVRKKLEDSHDSAAMCKKLATLQADVPIHFDLDSCRVKQFNAQAARKIFDELGFKSLKSRLDEMYGVEVGQAALF